MKNLLIFLAKILKAIFLPKIKLPKREPHSSLNGTTNLKLTYGVSSNPYEIRNTNLSPKNGDNLSQENSEQNIFNFPTEDQVIEFFSGQENEIHLVDIIAHFTGISLKESLPDNTTQKIYSDYLSQLVSKGILTVDSTYYCQGSIG